MSLLSPGELHRLIAEYGYWLVASLVGLEGLGIPVPGEAALIAAALIAASATHDLNIALVIGAATCGAIIGDNLGFWIGRGLGARLLFRYGRHVGMTESKIKLGRYLFMRHGMKVAFIGRFVAVLRTLAPFLAGANMMSWPRFAVANAAGGITWATAYGLGAYFLGGEIHHLTGTVRTAAIILAACAAVAGLLFLRSHAVRLEEAAERALPGPLRPSRRRRLSR